MKGAEGGLGCVSGDGAVSCKKSRMYASLALAGDGPRRTAALVMGSCRIKYEAVASCLWKEEMTA